MHFKSDISEKDFIHSYASDVAIWNQLQFKNRGMPRFGRGVTLMVDAKQVSQPSILVATRHIVALRVQLGKSDG